MMSIMADTIKSPSLTTEEIEDQLNAIGFEYEALQKNGEQLVTDALHEVAFQVGGHTSQR
jgi:predicted Zn-dependent peptidase